MAEMRDAGSKIQDVGRQLRALADLDAIVSDQEQPTVLVEGTRQLPWQDWELVCRMGEFLARRYPAMLFRTGNATGSDEAFAEGVARVDPSRIQYVIPHPGMGRQRRYPQARTSVLRDVPAAREGELAAQTLTASPKSDRLVRASRGELTNRRLAAAGRYLLRDTLKVTGCPELELAPAVAGIFYVNEADPLGAGTGHTIRVCQAHGVPVAFQDCWRSWLE